MKRPCRALLLMVLAAALRTAAQTGAPVPSPPAESKPCVEPAPLFSADDYDGPFNKLVAYFSRKLEIKTVRAPNRHAPKKLCALDAGGKFDLFVSNSFEPVNFIGAGF